MLDDQAKNNLVNNIAGHLKDAQEFIQKRVIANFAAADPEYGRRIQQAIDKINQKSIANGI